MARGLSKRSVSAEASAVKVMVSPPKAETMTKSLPCSRHPSTPLRMTIAAGVAKLFLASPLHICRVSGTNGHVPCTNSF
jgi:hypothetical protein